VPFSGLNVEMAFINPMVPIEIKSSLSLMVELYFFTMWATSLKFLSISMFRASSSPFLRDLNNTVLPQDLKVGEKN